MQLVTDRHATQPLEPCAPRGVVVAEELAVSDVAADHGQAAVACLVHDDAFGNTPGRGRGRQACPQAVAGEPGRIEAGPFGPTLDDAGHAAIGQARVPQPTAGVQSQEERVVVVGWKPDAYGVTP